MEEAVPWLAQEDPARRFDGWTWLDNCPSCIVSLKREAAERPCFILCLKTAVDRVFVTAEYLAATLACGKDFESLCFTRDDWVREVIALPRAWLPAPARWSSLTLREREARDGRPSRHTLRRVAEGRGSFNCRVTDIGCDTLAELVVTS